MSTYKFEMNIDEWDDDDEGVHRAPCKVIFVGGGEDIHSIVADFKDWLRATSFSPATIAKVIVED